MEMEEYEVTIREVIIHTKIVKAVNEFMAKQTVRETIADEMKDRIFVDLTYTCKKI